MQYIDSLLIFASATLFGIADSLRGEIPRSQYQPNLPASLCELGACLAGALGCVIAGRTESEDIFVVWGWCGIQFILVTAAFLAVKRVFLRPKS